MTRSATTSAAWRAAAAVAGWLHHTGAVAGRKDVGGIVGQLEPEVLKTFSQDFLDKLLTQLDSLQDIMDRTANHADSISDSVHHQMNDLSAKTRTVKDIAKDLTDAMTDWANGNIDQINELSARISWSLDQLDDIMDDAVPTDGGVGQAHRTVRTGPSKAGNSPPGVG